MVFIPDGLIDGKADAPAKRHAYVGKSSIGYVLGVLGAVASAAGPVAYRAIVPVTAAAIVETACGKSPTGPDSYPTPTPTTSPTPPQATKNTIVDRIDGSPISGSGILFEGINGPGFGTVVGPVDITGGEYSANLQLGTTYKVTITGSGHVRHENLSYKVNAVNGNNFTVIEWGSGQDGVNYDPTFDGFFQSFARNEGNPDSWRGIQKWDMSKPPKEIYISLTVPSSSQNHTGWNPEAVVEFKALLNEVLSESLSGLFCGNVPSLQINEGSSIGFYKSGTLIALINKGDTLIGDIHKDANGYVDGETLNLIDQTFNDPQKYRSPATRNQLKAILLHELTHFAGGFDAFNGPYARSIMGSDYLSRLHTQLSPEDRFGLCLIEKPDTKPRNQKPDINMSGVTAASAGTAVGLNDAPMHLPVLIPNQMPREREMPDRRDREKPWLRDREQAPRMRRPRTVNRKRYQGYQRY